MLILQILEKKRMVKRRNSVQLPKLKLKKKEKTSVKIKI
jgi:hypothetical protein